MRLLALSLSLITLSLAGCNYYNGPDRATPGAGLSRCLTLQRELNVGYHHRKEDRRMNPATRARLIKQYDRYDCNQVYHLGDLQTPVDMTSRKSIKK